MAKGPFGTLLRNLTIMDFKRNPQKLESFNGPVSAHPVLRFMDITETSHQLRTKSQAKHHAFTWSISVLLLTFISSLNWARKPSAEAEFFGKN